MCIHFDKDEESMPTPVETEKEPFTADMMSLGHQLSNTLSLEQLKALAALVGVTAGFMLDPVLGLLTARSSARWIRYSPTNRDAAEMILGAVSYAIDQAGVATGFIDTEVGA